MTGRMLLAAAVLFAASCAPAGMPPYESPTPTVVVETLWSVEVDATWPTDVLAGEGGGFLVLDGYRGRALAYDAAQRARGAIGDVATWGHPVRLASASDGGVWLVDPKGRLVRVDELGGVLASVQVGTEVGLPGDGSGEPVAVLDLGPELVVADRLGSLAWLDPDDGRRIREIRADVDEVPLGLVTDLALEPDGQILAADALGARIHRVVPDNGARVTFGRYGMWAGYLAQPKSVAPVAGGGVLIGDTALGVVQLFDGVGNPVALLADGDGPLRVEHPIALEPWGEDGRTFLVLDAATATIWCVRLPEDDLQRLMDAPRRRWLRSPLVEGDVNPAGANGRTCLQCHDGFVRDGRHVWDESLHHHPIGEEVERELPAAFPLDEQGRMTCTTCHSPHGSSTLEEVNAVDSDTERDQLVRHSSEAEPFTRLSRKDSALCIACHAETAHDDAIARLGIGGRGHPVGSALVDALAESGAGSDQKDRAECLGCHAVHGATSEQLARDTRDGKLCVSCHEAQGEAALSHPIGLTGAAREPSPRGSATLPLDPRGRTTCETCHDLTGGRTEALLRVTPDRGSLCGSCHATEAHAVATQHGIASGPRGITCLGCHDTHGTTASEALVATRAGGTAADPSGCLGCHGPRGSAAKAGVRPGLAGHPVDAGVTTAEGEPLTCGSCHEDPHGPAAGGSEGCLTCHDEQAEAKARGGHGNVSCLECHPAHADAPLAPETRVDHNPASRRCLSCHAPESRAQAPKVPAYDHPAPVFAMDGSRWKPLADLPLFSEEGEEQPHGVNGDLTCASCHLTHGPDATKQADSLRRPGWQEACSSCHGANALPLYRYFHQPDRRRGVEIGP